MRRFLIISVIVSGVLLGFVSYERFVVEATIGPAAVFATLALGCVFLFLLVTLLLYRSRYRALMANLWMVIASVTITYIIVDLAAGAILIQRLSPPLVPDEYRHHKLVPDFYARFQQRDFNYIQRVNNLGLRGVNRTLEKPDNTFRILMLGDSFTMGKGVDDDQTFPVLLERSLNHSYSTCSGKTVEVLNADVDSYAPILSYMHLKRDLYRLGSDLVVLNLDVSDLVQEEAYRRVAVYGANGDLIGVPQLDRKSASLNERIRVWTDRHLYLTRLLLFHVNRLFDYGDLTVRDVVTHANFEVAAHTLAGDTTPREEQWSHLFDSILKIKAFAAGKDMGFVLSAYPWGHQVSDTEWLPGRFGFMPEGAVASDRSLDRIGKFVAGNDVEFVDLFAEFREDSGGERLYFQYDNHWTPAGHEVVARGLERHLRRTVFASWCRQPS